jgi:preprotein translocase subunit SecD
MVNECTNIIMVCGEKKMNLLKNWRILILLLFLTLAFGIIFIPTGHNEKGYLDNTNIKLGLDFEGGTLLQIELQEEVSQDEISRIANIISQRIDPSGLKDFSVTPIGRQFIVIQLSETDQVELEKIETRIRQQGKFEANLNGETVFTGDEIRKVLRGENSFGVYKQGNNAFEWSLPFVLNEQATNSFTEKTFHQCSITSYDSAGKPVYDCEKTIFFLDKPEAIIVISEEQYLEDEDEIFIGNPLLNIPPQTEIAEVIEDSMLSVIIYDGALDENLLSNTNFTKAIVSLDLNNEVVLTLKDKGFEVEKKDFEEGPWLWNALNAQQIISLTPGITNEGVSDISQAEQFSTLRISGTRETAQEALNDLEELAILLESGSLPTPVKSISKESISPSLGEAFKSLVIIMGFIAFIVVGIVIVIRYKNWRLALPIFIIGGSEVIINVAFIVLTQRPLDLASFAGLIAAIGTGVDSEIVITDEIMAKSKKVKESLLKRTKAALFIIMTSAFTMIAVMLPIIIFSRAYPGIDKLYGFAVVAIAGALIGVFITRPAFTKIIENIIGKIEKE